VRCPSCGDEDNRVIDTRVSRDGEEIRRRRECEECGRRFTTRERYEMQLPKIIKRDERRESYERTKLLAGIENACVKRPIRVEAIEAMLDRIERWMQESGEREISSGDLGERVMAELSALDALAAVRFASVFQSFQRTEDYAAFFARLSEKEERPAGPGPPTAAEDAAE